jgi:hypothetical protein
MIEGRVTSANADHVSVETDVGILEGISSDTNLKVGAPAVCCIRPECIALASPSDPGPNRIRAKLDREVFLGEVRHVYLRAGKRTLESYRLQANPAAAGEEVECVVARDDVVVLPTD